MFAKEEYATFPYKISPGLMQKEHEPKEKGCTRQKQRAGPLHRGTLHRSWEQEQMQGVRENRVPGS